MNIALIGYGRMGKAIHEIAEAHGATVTLIVDPTADVAHAKTIDEADFSGVDCAIDYTHPDTAIENVQKLADKGVNIVMGTTGWYDQEDKVRQIVEDAGIAFLWASNFSIGVHLFWKMLRKAGEIMNKYEEYDVYGHEFHHKMKADSPSGTAITTAKQILETVDRKDTMVTEELKRKPEANELHFSATRGGYVTGDHSIFFDSPTDYIEIKHSARNRSGYAIGSVETAKWLEGKKGFFSIEDFLNDK